MPLPPLSERTVDYAEERLLWDAAFQSVRLRRAFTVSTVNTSRHYFARVDWLRSCSQEHAMQTRWSMPRVVKVTTL